MLSMVWDAPALGGDVEFGPEGLASDATLRTAILVSLFTDRRASVDDALPDGGGDRRGWVGDALADIEGDRIGSRLWLLKRRKQTEETRLDAVDYCDEALRWLVEDGVASAVEVQAAWIASGVISATIDVTLVDGSSQAFTYNVSTSV